MSTIEQIIISLKQLEGKAKDRGAVILKQEVKTSLMLNFEAQGRPIKWDKKKHPDGRAILTGPSGNLQATINIQDRVSSQGVIIDMGSRLIYSRIQNEGGNIQRSSRAYNFRKSRKTGRDVFARNGRKSYSKVVEGKAYTITIPPRRFLVIPESDYPRILNALQLGLNLHL